MKTQQRIAWTSIFIFGTIGFVLALFGIWFAPPDIQEKIAATDTLLFIMSSLLLIAAI